MSNILNIAATGIRTAFPPMGNAGILKSPALAFVEAFMAKHGHGDAQVIGQELGKLSLDNPALAQTIKDELAPALVKLGPVAQGSFERAYAAEAKGAQQAGLVQDSQNVTATDVLSKADKALWKDENLADAKYLEIPKAKESLQKAERALDIATQTRDTVKLAHDGIAAKGITPENRKAIAEQITKAQAALTTEAHKNHEDAKKLYDTSKAGGADAAKLDSLKNKMDAALALYKETDKASKNIGDIWNKAVQMADQGKPDEDVVKKIAVQLAAHENDVTKRTAENSAAKDTLSASETKYKQLQAIEQKVMASFIDKPYSIRQLKVDAAGNPVVDAKNKPQYETVTETYKGPKGIFTSEKAAAQDAIALSFAMRKTFGDSWERGGEINRNKVTGQYSYTIKLGTVGTAAWQTKRDIGIDQAFVPGLGVGDKTTAYWHTHPTGNPADINFSQSADPKGKADVEAFMDLNKTRAIPLTAYLGGHDGSFDSLKSDKTNGLGYRKDDSYANYFQNR